METIEPVEVKISSLPKVDVCLGDPPLYQYFRIRERLENPLGCCLENVGLLDDQFTLLLKLSRCRLVAASRVSLFHKFLDLSDEVAPTVRASLVAFAFRH